MKKTLSLSMAMPEFDKSANRTNWMTFRGTCAFVDQPSDGIPSGGVDKPVLFPKADMELALPTFVNMGVNCSYCDFCADEMFEGHDSTNKVGVVNTATIVANEVVIAGGLWSYDFEELCGKVQSAKSSLGWSIEVLMVLADKGDYYEATEIEFLGVALMFSDKAAFKKTYLAAQRKKGDIIMDEKQLQVLLAGFAAGITKSMNDSIEGVKAEFSVQLDQVTAGFTEMKAEKVAEKAELALAAEVAQAAQVAADKVALDLAEATTAADAETARLAGVAAEKVKTDLAAQRQTMQFGNRVSKFEGDTDAQKAIISNEKLTVPEQFRKLIELKMSAAKA